MSKKKRENAGAGYGYMFSGAFKDKKDAVAKEKTRKGSFIKGVYTQQGHRYVVMTPRTNPRKTKPRENFLPQKGERRAAVRAIAAFRKMEKLLAEGKIERSNKIRMHIARLNTRYGWTMADVAAMARGDFKDNPSELLVMGANPSGSREITVPPGTTITIRTNPETNPPEHYSSAQAHARGARYRAPGLIQTPRQRRVAGMVRKASGTESSRLGRSFRKYKAGPRPSRSAAKVFHELYSRENPICGHSVGGGEVCTRKPGHKGPHLPQGATMRTRSRLRAAWQPRKKNPSAAALRESFTGQPAETISSYDEPCMPAGDYAQLGELLALHVKPRAGGQVQVITCKRDARPLVLADESGRQIYFSGGDQDLTAALGVFGAADRGENLFELGEARRIDYKQRKEHLPDPDTDEWKHYFGEENGIRPIAIFDARHRRILLEGGDYRIRPEGIVN